jgi:hypothetical protein
MDMLVVNVGIHHVPFPDLRPKGMSFDSEICRCTLEIGITCGCSQEMRIILVLSIRNGATPTILYIGLQSRTHFGVTPNMTNFE